MRRLGCPQGINPRLYHRYGHNLPTLDKNWQIHTEPLHGTSGLEAFIHDQSTLQIDVQGFSEHCLDTTKFQILQRAREILRRQFPGHSTIQLHSSRETSLHSYKPGGTGILVLGKLTSQLESRSRGGDPLGRWSYLSLRRQHFPPITVVSVYQVCPRPTNSIGNTAYHQQERLLHSQGRDIHPRKAFMEDLYKFLETYRQKGHDLIIGGDFNESYQDKNSGVLQLASSLQLTDPYLHKFPHSPEFGTHESGRRRIDLLLVSPGILPCIQKVGYAPFEYATHSDHRPVLIDLNTNLMLGKGPTQALPTNRILQTKDKAAVVKYVSHLYESLCNHQAFSIQEKLDNNTALPSEAEDLDALIGTLEEAAEQKCKRRRPEYFSHALVQQRFKVSILRRHLLALQKDQDRSEQLIHKMTRVGLFFELPPTKTLTKQALSQARAILMETCRKSFEVRQAEQAQYIEELRAAKKCSRQKIVSAIRRAEQAKATYKTLQAIKSSKEGSSAVDHVEVPLSWPSSLQLISHLSALEDPKTCTEWKKVTDPNEMEQYLLLRNRLHFGQAQGSPFTISPLREEIDWLATSPAAEEILQGKYESPIDHPQVKNLLENCAAITPLDSIPRQLTIEEFREKIRSWRESTTTSPSGRHLGRYKSLFVRITDTNDPSGSPAELPFSDKQAQIALLKLSCNR